MLCLISSLSRAFVLMFGIGKGKEVSMSKKEVQPPAYGHVADAAVDIEGLEVIICFHLLFWKQNTEVVFFSKLLEAHFEKLRAEGNDGDGANEDEGGEEDWEGWEVDSESSDSSSEGWIDVSSDEEEEIYISESEDESSKKGKRKEEKHDAGVEAMNTTTDLQPQTEAAARVSSLATTKVSHPSAVLPEQSWFNDYFSSCSNSDSYSR